MNLTFFKDLVQLLEHFQLSATNNRYPESIEGFKQWITDLNSYNNSEPEPSWEGKENGRTPESVISTLLVHMNRYAKTYSRSAIHDSSFSTQDEFIFLITLKAFGPMTKMELIKKNIQDKPAGMNIIYRLIGHGWIEQKESDTDKRSKILHLTEKGSATLDAQMDKIRKATSLVTGDLTHNEKMQLIRLLQKLEDFHLPVFYQNYHPSELLEKLSGENIPALTE